MYVSTYAQFFFEDNFSPNGFSYRVPTSKVGVGRGVAEGVAGVSLWSWRCLFADAGEVSF